MKKIAIIAPSKLPIPAVQGGATQNLINHLLDENEMHQKIQFTVYSYYSEKAEKESQKYRNAKFVYFNDNTLFKNIYDIFWRLLRKISMHKTYLRSSFVNKCIKNIKNNEFDFILVEGNHFQVLQLYSQLNTDIILCMHTDALNKDTDNGIKILRASKKVLAISEFCRNRIIEINPCEKYKVILFKNAIDTELFDNRLYQGFRNKFRQNNNIDGNQKLFMYCGRLSEPKGVKEALLAFKEIKNKNIKFLIVGSFFFSVNKETEYIKELKRIAETIPEQVIFLGYIPYESLPQYYAAADIFICPSISNEAAGLVNIEALSSGLPVIASNKGGIPEYVDPKSSIIVNVDNNYIESLSCACNQMLDEDFYNFKKKNARNSVKDMDKREYYKRFIEIVFEK